MKTKYDNLLGQRFGRLLVLSLEGRAKNRTILWKCLCDCGNIIIVRANHLKHGHTKSCGCFHKEKINGLYVRDLLGKRFGRLLVIEQTNKRLQRAQVWKCLCDCGNFVYVHTASLTTGHTKSCGCLHFDTVWKGGVSCAPYCQEWTKELKDFIKARDGHRCLNPYCYGTDTTLAVHHIDYNKKHCSPSNLITICRACNSRANHARRWHKSWYRAIMYRRYGYED